MKKSNEWTFAEIEVEKPNNKRMFTPLFIVVLILLVILLIVTVFLGVSNSVLKQEIYKKESTISDLNKTIEYQEDKNESLQTEVNSYRNSYFEILPTYNFYNEHAVCVNKNSDYYHKYECDDFDKSYFYIFNTENAEGQGYYPCPRCMK